MAIDLHAHTRASDGSMEPSELVQLAKTTGLSAVAVTDHDTFGGWEEAIAEGEKLGVEVVPGIELSVSDDEFGKFHLLGYYVSLDSELAERLKAIQDSRANRNVVILDNLARLGVPVSMERVQEIAGEDAQIGRPHIARAMMEKGYVASVQEAFNTYLANDGPAYANKLGFTPAEAVRLIHDAGGVAIWAHPLRPPSKRDATPSLEATEKLIQVWKEWGLDGFEVYYGDYSQAEAQWSAQMAEKYGLIGTGGSDFHGVSKPTIFLGQVNEGKNVPDDVLDVLRSKRVVR